jgi:hypothetical protein
MAIMKRRLIVEVPDDVDEVILEHPSGETDAVYVEHADADEDEDEDADADADEDEDADADEDEGHQDLKGKGR